MLALYKALATALGPAIDLYLARRLARGREDRARIGERRGIAGATRPAGRLVWLHAASVGEAVGLLAAIEALSRERPDLALLMTTGTVTSADAMARRLPDRAIHQYVPLDRPAWVRRFLDHWQPDAAIWMESELWPVLVTETASRGVPVVLVDARLSRGAFKRWRRIGGVARRVFGSLDLVLASSAEQADRFRALGCRDVRALGTLKAAAAPPPVDSATLTGLREAIAGRPVWLAANTHKGEEATVLDAHARLAAECPEILTVIAPRHAGRGEEIAALCAARGLTCARRSARENPSPRIAVYLADTMGEMPALYSAIPITFLAGSLVPVGGHNPIEPAHCGTALLVGPMIANNRDATDALLTAGAAREIADSAALATAILALWRDPAARDGMASAGRDVASRGRQDLRGLLDALARFLPPGPGA